MGVARRGLRRFGAGGTLSQQIAAKQNTNGTICQRGGETARLRISVFPALLARVGRQPILDRGLPPSILDCMRCSFQRRKTTNPRQGITTCTLPKLTYMIGQPRSEDNQSSTGDYHKMSIVTSSPPKSESEDNQSSTGDYHRRCRADHVFCLD